MLILQVSAAHGPAECQIAVALAVKKLCEKALEIGLNVELLEENESKEGYFSVALSIEGPEEEAFCSSWEGTIQWICQSPLRPSYPRKNWFIGVSKLSAPKETFQDDEILFKACRASGPGGQHVNKTDSAVQATHVASGISVKVQSQRSQFANKKLAKQLIAIKLAQAAQEEKASREKTANSLHWQVQRGSPKKIFRGPSFKED